MQPNASVQMLSVNGKPSSVQLPASVELAVVETEPGVKGDTVSNVTKPATLETGAVVQVPLFVNVGDRMKVDPRERPLHLAGLAQGERARERPRRDRRRCRLLGSRPRRRSATGIEVVRAYGLADRAHAIPNEARHAVRHRERLEGFRRRW